MTARNPPPAASPRSICFASAPCWAKPPGIGNAVSAPSRRSAAAGNGPRTPSRSSSARSNWDSNLPADPAFQALAAVVAEAFGPRRSVLAADGGEGQRWLAARSPWLAELRAPGGRPAAFLCEEERCLPPVADPAALRDLLASPDGRSAAL